MEKYHIGHCIGEGCFGKVFKGRRKYSTQGVALKFIAKQGKRDKDLENLRQEIAILKRLQHPNIIKLLDSFETPTDFCVVTEFAQGELFEIFQDEEKFPESQVRLIAQQLVRALHYLHSNRVIHRDMKPQNILIGTHRAVKLCDFGFARAMSCNTMVLHSIKGTPLYMAPELVTEQPYNHNADLWSLGIILYELFMGLPPFYTKSLMHLISLISKSPVHYSPDMSPAFRSFLYGLLQKDPGKRLTWPQLGYHAFVCDPATRDPTVGPFHLSVPAVSALAPFSGLAKHQAPADGVDKENLDTRNNQPAKSPTPTHAEPVSRQRYERGREKEGDHKERGDRQHPPRPNRFVPLAANETRDNEKENQRDIESRQKPAIRIPPPPPLSEVAGRAFSNPSSSSHRIPPTIPVDLRAVRGAEGRLPPPTCMPSPDGVSPTSQPPTPTASTAATRHTLARAEKQMAFLRTTAERHLAALATGRRPEMISRFSSLMRDLGLVGAGGGRGLGGAGAPPLAGTGTGEGAQLNGLLRLVLRLFSPAFAADLSDKETENVATLKRLTGESLRLGAALAAALAGVGVAGGAGNVCLTGVDAEGTHQCWKALQSCLGIFSYFLRRPEKCLLEGAQKGAEGHRRGGGAGWSEQEQSGWRRGLHSDTLPFILTPVPSASEEKAETTAATPLYLLQSIAVSLSKGSPLHADLASSRAALVDAVSVVFAALPAGSRNPVVVGALESLRTFQWKGGVKGDSSGGCFVSGIFALVRAVVTFWSQASGVLSGSLHNMQQQGTQQGPETAQLMVFSEKLGRYATETLSSLVAVEGCVDSVALGTEVFGLNTLRLPDLLMNLAKQTALYTRNEGVRGEGGRAEQRTSPSPCALGAQSASLVVLEWMASLPPSVFPGSAGSLLFEAGQLVDRERRGMDGEKMGGATTDVAGLPLSVLLRTLDHSSAVAETEWRKKSEEIGSPLSAPTADPETESGKVGGEDLKSPSSAPRSAGGGKKGQAEACRGSSGDMYFHHRSVVCLCMRILSRFLAARLVGHSPFPSQRRQGTPRDRRKVSGNHEGPEQGVVLCILARSASSMKKGAANVHPAFLAALVRRSCLELRRSASRVQKATEREAGSDSSDALLSGCLAARLLLEAIAAIQSLEGAAGAQGWTAFAQVAPESVVEAAIELLRVLHSGGERRWKPLLMPVLAYTGIPVSAAATEEGAMQLAACLPGLVALALQKPRVAITQAAFFSASPAGVAERVLSDGRVFSLFSEWLEREAGSPSRRQDSKCLGEGRGEGPEALAFACDVVASSLAQAGGARKGWNRGCSGDAEEVQRETRLWRKLLSRLNEWQSVWCCPVGREQHKGRDGQRDDRLLISGLATARSVYEALLRLASSSASPHVSPSAVPRETSPADLREAAKFLRLAAATQASLPSSASVSSRSPPPPPTSLPGLSPKRGGDEGVVSGATRESLRGAARAAVSFLSFELNEYMKAQRAGASGGTAHGSILKHFEEGQGTGDREAGGDLLAVIVDTLELLGGADKAPGVGFALTFANALLKGSEEAEGASRRLVPVFRRLPELLRDECVDVRHAALSLCPFALSSRKGSGGETRPEGAEEGGVSHLGGEDAWRPATMEALLERARDEDAGCRVKTAEVLQTLFRQGFPFSFPCSSAEGERAAPSSSSSSSSSRRKQEKGKTQQDETRKGNSQQLCTTRAIRSLQVLLKDSNEGVCRQAVASLRTALGRSGAAVDAALNLDVCSDLCALTESGLRRAETDIRAACNAVVEERGREKERSGEREGEAALESLATVSLQFFEGPLFREAFRALQSLCALRSDLASRALKQTDAREVSARIRDLSARVRDACKRGNLAEALSQAEKNDQRQRVRLLRQLSGVGEWPLVRASEDVARRMDSFHR
uniref:non-specific serine/threonine protein kinase n=1 Tax=Chromera velia CCMP2878 TaxID=1169474 RepID=A0A0G4IEY6_9ALVE|eukprot:Cvel_13894.t1-p1 / transcript=Cvel_13894.t1 / gene=Cvel_13894 / organism=Chromera_velia_CCMP2878 / gene_product=Serine/threonine-protein kinase TIO, putative / transcript_product=Serine/threonine-protein kinase TIO, putative / location=Cvel_scaffold968:4474-12856(-) / protein_length=1896 / sequence_SO=supercontig / SO=protein_coding / is_pseudo=false